MPVQVMDSTAHQGDVVLEVGQAGLIDGHLRLPCRPYEPEAEEQQMGSLAILAAGIRVDLLHGHTCTGSGSDLPQGQEMSCRCRLCSVA